MYPIHIYIQIIDLIEATVGQTPEVMAQALVGYARQVQEDPNAYVPFGVEAAAAGRHAQKSTATHCNTLRHTATCCNLLQHAATRCNTLQHTATHFLQRK